MANNQISVSPSLLDDGMLASVMQGSDNILEALGIRFRPSNSTSVRVRFLGSGSIAALGLLRRAIDLNLSLEDNSKICIGSDTSFRRHVRIHAGASTSILIGEDCMFSSSITIRSTDSRSIYEIGNGERLNKNRDILIGSHVWVCEGVRILKGARIGDGSILGAGAIVSGNVPNNSICAGNPAKIIRTNVRWER